MRLHILLLRLVIFTPIGLLILLAMTIAGLGSLVALLAARLATWLDKVLPETIP